MSLGIVIDARSLSYVREGEPIVDRFTFRVLQGQFVGVIGPNGGGKSTLVKVILGLLPATSGSLKVFKGSPTDRSVRQRIAYVPQRGGNIDSQFPATVDEVVRSGLVGRLGNDPDSVENALAVMKATHLRKRTLGRLSGGERQRVLIARALAAQPDLLVLDEPTDGLDPETQNDFYRTLRILRKKTGMAILFVSHDVHTIAREADSALCLQHKLVCHGHRMCVLPKGKIHNAFHSEHKDLAEHHAEPHEEFQV